MALYQLIYLSELAADESVLSGIHSHAVRNNTAHTVTGMLIYANGRFLQMLEGERKDVLHTYERIQQDPRHRHVSLVLQRDISARLFSHWNMGFRHLAAEELQEQSEWLNYFDGEFAKSKADSQSALCIFEHFAKAAT